MLQNFDRYRCCQLVLDCLCEYNDPTMVQMSIAICGILAAKVNHQHTSILHPLRTTCFCLFAFRQVKHKLNVASVIF